MTADRPKTAAGPVPVVTIDAGSSPGLGDALHGLEAACQSGRRFAVLVDARDAADEHEPPDEGRRSHLRRLRTLRPHMKERCVGLAFLTTPDRMPAQGRRIRAARLMFGCAVGAFHSPADAWSWLAERGAAPESGFQP